MVIAKDYKHPKYSLMGRLAERNGLQPHNKILCSCKKEGGKPLDTYVESGLQHIFSESK